MIYRSDNDEYPEGFEYIVGTGHISALDTSVKSNKKKRDFPIGFAPPQVEKPKLKKKSKSKPRKPVVRGSNGQSNRKRNLQQRKR